MNNTNDSPGSRLSHMLTYNLTQMIYVIVKLGIPDVLAAKSMHVDDLAASVKVHPRSLHRVLRALASQGVFTEESPGHFALTPLSELLRSDIPDSLRPFALSYGEPWWWNAWGNLLHSVQTGETAFDSVFGMGFFEYLNQAPDAASIFNANMTAMTVQEGQAVVMAYDFSLIGTLVDIGGGHGELVSAILQAYPQVHAVVFDQPSVIEGTRLRLEVAGLDERCEIKGGSFFESIPKGGDIYTLKDILHDWDDEQAIAILRNCHRSMSTSAKLLIIERIIPPGNDHTIGKLIDISMLVLTGGRERTKAEYNSLLDAAGFHVTNIFSTNMDTSIIEARRA
jgi:hypothetical protein